MIKKMKNKKITSIVVACTIFIATLGSMSLIYKPNVVKASNGNIEAVIEENINESVGTISITGTAFSECKPDRVILYLKIIGKNLESAQKARDEAAVIIDKVMTSLRKLGIPEENIGTTGYNLEAKYEWEYDEHNVHKKVFKGYIATVTIKITLKEGDFDKAGKVVDASVNSGAFVDSINFELSKEKRDEIKLQLLAEAAKNAKLKAEIIVNALGYKLGNVKSVSVDNYDYQPYVYWRNSIDLSYSAKNIAPPTSILPTDLTVSAKVHVVFEII